MSDTSVSSVAVPRISRTRLVAVLLFAFVAAYVMLVVAYRGPSRTAALDLMNIVMPLAAAAVCFVAAKRATDKRQHIFWLLMVVALIASAGAEATWAWYELVLRIMAPYPSTADVLWLAFYPLVLVAIMVLVSFRGKDKFSAAAIALDVFTFGVAFLAVIWQLGILATIHSSANSLTNLMNAAYPVGDVMLLAALASLALIPAGRCRPSGILWLAPSFLINILADSVYLIAKGNGTYATGSWIDPLWILAYSFIGMGALVFIEASSRQARVVPLSIRAGNGWGARLRTVLPYATVPMAAFILYDQFVAHSHPGKIGDLVVVCITLLLIVLVLVRQMITIGELGAEKRHLALLHDAARALARCKTSKEVLRVGTRVVKRGATCDAVAVWLASNDSRARLTACDGFSRSGRRMLREALSGSPQVKRTLTKGETMLFRGADLLKSAGRNGDAAPLTMIAAIPLMCRRRYLGAICIAMDGSGDHAETSVRYRNGVRRSPAPRNARPPG